MLTPEAAAQALTDELYAQFRTLLLGRYGLAYPERKRADLAHGLQLVLHATGVPTLATLYARVSAESELADAMLQQLTVGETFFFRNTPQFDALRQHLVPDMLARRQLTQTLRVWSAGCATGEEPYSLAMVLADLLPAAWHASILATDINPQFLAQAQAASYGAWSFRETTPEQRARFFTPDGNRWLLQPEIRRLVRFMRLNLAEASYPQIGNGTGAMDLILCRNVTIYFDEATTRQVAERFYEALTPGGWLVVGHSEPQASVYHQFETHNFPDTVIYRKPLGAPLFAVARPAAPPAPRPAPDRAAAKLPAAPAPSVPRAAPPRAPTPAPDPAATAQELLRQAQQAAERGDWPQAEQHSRAALTADALLVGAHYLLGQSHEQQGDLDAALACYRRTVYLDRTFVAGTLGLANVWRQLGRAADALRCYRNALAYLDTLPPRALVLLPKPTAAGELAGLVRAQLAQLGEPPT